MRRAGYALVAVATLTAVAVGLVLTVDLGRFKGPIQALVSNLLGRELTVEVLSLRVGRKIRVRAEGARLASTAWTPTPDLVAADEVEVTLDTLALLDQIVLFDAIRGSGIRVHAVIDPHLGDNFSFSELGEEPSASADDAEYFLVIRSARVRDVMISISAAELDVELAASQIHIDQGDDGTLGIDIDGTLNGTPLGLAGTVGPLDNILAGSNVGFDVAGNAGELTLNATGAIDVLAAPERPEIQFTITGPNAEYLTDILNIDPITSGPFDLHGQLVPDGERMRGSARGTYGEFRLAADAVASSLQVLDQLDVTLEASGPNVATVAALTGNPGFPEVPFSVQGVGTRVGELLTVERVQATVGDATLELTGQLPHFPSPAGARASISAHVPNLRQYYRLLGLATPLPGGFDLEGTLEQSADGSTPLTLSVRSSHLEVQLDGTLSAHPSLVGSTLAVRAAGPDLATVGKALGLDQGIPRQPFNVESSVVVAEGGLQLSHGRASMGANQATFGGFVANDPMAPETELTLTARVPDPTRTLAVLGQDYSQLPPGPLAVDGIVARSADGFEFRDVRVRMNGLTALVEGHANDAFDALDLSLATSGPDVRVLAADLPEGLLAALPFETSARIRLRGDQLRVSNAQARLGRARAEADLETTLAFAEIKARVEGSAPSLKELVPRAAEYMEADDGIDIEGEFQWRDDTLHVTDDILLRAGRSTLQVSGTFDGPPDFAKTKLRLEVRMPNLEALNIFVEEPLDLAGVISGTRNALKLTDLRAAVGKSVVTGSATYQSAETPYIDVDLESDYIDLRPWKTALASKEGDAPSTPPERSATGRVIPDVALPEHILTALNGELDLVIRALKLDYYALRDIEVRATLADNELNVRRLALTGNRGTLGGSAKLTREEQTLAVETMIDGRELTLGLPADSEESLAALPRYVVDAALNARGRTTLELAGSMNGHLRLVAGEGQLALRELNLFMHDFAGQLVTAVNPFATRDPYTQVQCAAVLLTANDGVIVGEPAFVLQTDKVNVAGRARVNLATERLNAGFTTQARRGLGVSLADLVNPYTEVGGSLASPTLQLNSRGVLVEGGAAVATAGLSILARQTSQRLFASRNPCASAIRRADKAREQR